MPSPDVPLSSDGEVTDPSQLYGLQPELFTEARNRLVKRLRAAGQRDEASRVAKLRRPPATAWALNQVARHQPELVVAVLDAAVGLGLATDAALGGDRSGLRPAQTAERQAVGAALDAAVRYLSAAGHPPSDQARQRMTATLRAAFVDDPVARHLREGTLESDHDAPGFGFGSPSVATDQGATTRLAPPVEAAEADARLGEGAQAEADARMGEAAEAAEAAKAAEAAEAAERRARLVEDAEQLARRARQLDAAAREAQDVADRARQAADRAAADAVEARRRAGEAEITEG